MAVNPPLPLLFHYLLASSWTWLAIFLATIATTLRALRLCPPRRRLLVNLETSQPPSSMAISSPPPSETEVSLFSSCTTEKPSFPSISLSRSFRRRARSKSSAALEKLHRNSEGFLRSSMELLSSVLDAEFSPSLKKIASASKSFNGDSSYEKTQQRPKHATVGNGRADLLDSANLGFKSGEVLGLGFGEGTLAQEKEAPCHSSVKEVLLHLDEDVSSSYHWLPSWAYSLCDPLQGTFSYPSPFSDGRDNSVDNFAPLQVSPCFEHQFRWDKLLESRLGLSWNLTPMAVSRCTQCRECTMESPNVVKMWTGQQKKLLKALHVDGSSAIALDVRARNGLACTGNIVGEVSLWELGRKACAKASVSFANPVWALSMNSEQGAAIVGGASGMGLWDQRSSICKPLSSIPHQKVHISALKSRGNGLCVVNDDHFLSMFDLRKLHGEPVFSGPVHHISSNADDEDEFDIWETLTCDFEDNDAAWEEDFVSSNGDVVKCPKGSSWLSWFASFLQVSSTSVP